jgi:uncharacterized paraquat-inducible protein A
LLKNSVFMGLTVYLIGLIVGSISVARLTTIKIALGAIPFIALTHLSYGFRFLQGYLKTGSLVSKLR